MADRAGRPMLGVAYLLVVALLVGVSVGIFTKAMPWQRTDDVVVRSEQVGLGLAPHSDVKYQGLRVGEVRSVDRDGMTSAVTLAIDPDLIDSIPASVDAMFAPKTFFGDKFVDLRRLAGAGSGPSLADGDTIEQSKRAVEIGEIFDRLVPVLRELQPERVSAILSSLAEILDGRGDDIARTLTLTREALTALEPSYGNLTADLRSLAKVSDVYADAAPDLLSGLDDAASISKDNLVKHHRDLRDALDDGAEAAKTTRRLIDRNGRALTTLTKRTRPVLSLLSYYSPTVPCILEALDYGNRLANFAAGVRGPYIPLSVDLVVDQPAYTYPNDLPSNPRSEAFVKNLPAQIPSFARHCPILPDRVLALPKNPPPYSWLPYGQTFNLDSP